MDERDAPRITIPPLTDAEIAEMKPGNVTWKPTHPFTPDVVAWARHMGQLRADTVKFLAERGYKAPDESMNFKAARQILAAVGRG